MFARQGCSVVGVDLSPTGIQQMLSAAETEGFEVEGVVSDIRDYKPQELFDVIVIDRTLHMLSVEAERLAILEVCTGCVAEGRYVLIADERANLPAFRDFFENDDKECRVLPQKNTAFHFVQFVGE